MKNQEVTDYIEGLESPQKGICDALRKSICKEFPDLEERWAWSRPTYYSGKKLICYLVANKNDVNLGFHFGSRLKDPDGLVIGTGANMRHVKIREQSELRLDYYQGLIEQSNELAQV